MEGVFGDFNFPRLFLHLLPPHLDTINFFLDLKSPQKIKPWYVNDLTVYSPTKHKVSWEPQLYQMEKYYKNMSTIVNTI